MGYIKIEFSDKTHNLELNEVHGGNLLDAVSSLIGATVDAMVDQSCTEEDIVEIIGMATARALADSLHPKKEEKTYKPDVKMKRADGTTREW